MSSLKPSIPKGTRDFGPEQMAKRNFIFNSIRNTYTRYGFLPLETPSMENLDVLTGKYGEEGDQLLFKILNSGDYLSKIDRNLLSETFSQNLTPLISEKGLRYDLTVPFARFVVMHQNEITLPFKRYQIQPVWRADRPQKGRYREFYQCDADIVGTDSLICEAEIIAIIHEVFKKLGIEDYTININHRKILSGLAEIIDSKDRENDLFVAIDKLDKIGLDKVLSELESKGFSTESLSVLKDVLNKKGNEGLKIEQVAARLADSETGKAGVEDMNEIMALAGTYLDDLSHINFDLTLARGLTYYTGAILEVKVNNVKIGSVGGGGRYDNLTGVFGLPGLSGIGFSFGVDRLYDVMDELTLFPKSQQVTTKVLLTYFDHSTRATAIKLLQELRQQGINAEIYPDLVKMKKQLNYANKKNIPFVVVIGEEELKNQRYGLKNMSTGEQKAVDKSTLLSIVNEHN